MGTVQIWHDLRTINHHPNRKGKRGKGDEDAGEEKAARARNEFLARKSALPLGKLGPVDHVDAAESKMK